MTFSGNGGARPTGAGEPDEPIGMKPGCKVLVSRFLRPSPFPSPARSGLLAVPGEEEPMHTLTDRVIVVTGGGGAIARSVLHAFAGAGAKLAVVAVTEERSRPAAEEVSGLAVGADLARPDGAERMVDAVLAR